MICVEFRFLAGSYHATPWGEHVNVGAIEWPPSPWRLCRAFLAAGFNHLGWESPAKLPSVAASLIAKLAEVLPLYTLPKANGAHTRHYMPSIDYKKSVLTFDTFAQIGRGENDVLRVYWPVELSDEEQKLFETLLDKLSYLGRAESWVSASLNTDSMPGADMCVMPWNEQSRISDSDRVELMAAQTEEQFTTWCESHKSQEIERLKADEIAKAERTGKTFKATPKKLQEFEAKANALFPANIIEVLCQSPKDVNDAGWNVPPGSRYVAYAVPRNALNAKRAEKVISETRKDSPTTAILSLTSDVLHGECLPPLKDALLRTEQLHQALISRADKLKPGCVSSCLTGMSPDRKEVLKENHSHVHILPLVLNTSLSQNAPENVQNPGLARIDHFLIHAEKGLDALTVQAISHVRKAYAKNSPDLFLALAGLGKREDCQNQIPALATSETWISCTPFVPPRFLKKKGANSLHGQILAEIADRRDSQGHSLPVPTSIEVQLENGWLPLNSEDDLREFWRRWHDTTISASERLSIRWRSFRLERPAYDRKPPVTMGFGLRLRFSEQVSGPLALGYCAHFGLGMFVPEQNSHN